jgi:hypothetical protein
MLAMTEPTIYRAMLESPADPQTAGASGPALVVLASDYSALRQRLAELEAHPLYRNPQYWHNPDDLARIGELADIERSLKDSLTIARMCIDRLGATLALIATPPRPDGTWNRDRQACYELAKQELERT